jgi:hypothetical protein
VRHSDASARVVSTEDGTRLNSNSNLDGGNMIRSALLLTLAALLAVATSCSANVDGSLAGASDADSETDTDAAEDGPRIHPVVPCGTSIFQCADGVDNDDDGLIDSDDPNCLGPCDNNESGFNPDIPGGISGGGSCTLDCYFDENSGSGGGDCIWHVGCDSLNPGAAWPGSDCSYVGDGNDASGGFSCMDHFVDQFGERTSCQSNCEWRTPNGCDCFGCCLFPTASQPNRYLLVGSRDPDGSQNCTYEDTLKDEPVHCKPCTPVPSCIKGCDECELCVGKLALPPHCLPEERCADGQQPCGLLGDESCAEGFYCLTGCCIFFGIPG